MMIISNTDLVSGEGSEDNSQFELKGNILQLLSALNYADGATRSIRIKATLVDQSYEQVVSISVNEFTGIYPTISSPSFENNTLMPRNFGFNNGNVSPDLDIMNIPSGTQSMMLTMNDLDDNGSFHWAVWNIPPDKENIAKGQLWGQGVIEGDNSFETGYTGPFPPSQHRYETAVYFLNSKLDVSSEKYFQLLTATTGKVIAKASIIGLYKP